MPPALVTISYLVAGMLFIFSLAGLSAQESARRGNLFGIAGMLIAVLVTAFGPGVSNYGVLIAALVVGGSIGAAEPQVDERGCRGDADERHHDPEAARGWSRCRSVTM